MSDSRYTEFTLIGEEIGLDRLGIETMADPAEMAVSGAAADFVTVDDAITFRATESFEGVDAAEHDHQTSLLAHDGVEDGDVRAVPDRTAAELIDEPATWVETGGERITYPDDITDGEERAYPSFVFVLERIPIEEPPSSESEYEELVTRHLDDGFEAELTSF